MEETLGNPMRYEAGEGTVCAHRTGSGWDGEELERIT